MSYITKIRTRTNGSHTQVLVLVQHPMLRGSPQDDPAAGTFIDQMSFSLNGRAVAIAELGPGVADNPLTAISVTGAKVGDKIAVAWTDNKGGSGGAEARVR